MFKLMIKITLNELRCQPPERVEFPGCLKCQILNSRNIARNPGWEFGSVIKIIIRRKKRFKGYWISLFEFNQQLKIKRFSE